MQATAIDASSVSGLGLPRATPSVFAFDEFELDEALFELRRAGVRVPVQPKVLALLMCVVRNSARVLTKEELLTRLWPHQVVGEGSLTRAVRAARVALGDRGDSQHTIRTVRGFGYRFVRSTRVIASFVTPPSVVGAGAVMR